MSDPERDPWNGIDRRIVGTESGGCVMNISGEMSDKVSAAILADYQQAEPPVRVITSGAAWGKSDFQAVPAVTVGPTAPPLRGVMSRPDQVPGLPTVSRRGNERNKPCICGSGKKAKKCCLLKMEMQLQETVKAHQDARMVAVQQQIIRALKDGKAAVESADGVSTFSDVTTAIESAQIGSKIFIPPGTHLLPPIQLPAGASIIGDRGEA